MVSLTKQLSFLPSFLPFPLSLMFQNIHNKMVSGARAESHSAVQGKYSSQKPIWYLLVCDLEHFSIFVFTDDSHLSVHYQSLHLCPIHCLTCSLLRNGSCQSSNQHDVRTEDGKEEGSSPWASWFGAKNRTIGSAKYTQSRDSCRAVWRTDHFQHLIF